MMSATAQLCAPVRVTTRRSTPSRTHRGPIRVRAGLFGGKTNDDPNAVCDEGLARTAKVGILGGGQLGRMLAIAASPMGVQLHCLRDLTRGGLASAIDEIARGAGVQI